MNKFDDYREALKNLERAIEAKDNAANVVVTRVGNVQIYLKDGSVDISSSTGTVLIPQEAVMEVATYLADIYGYKLVKEEGDAQ